MKKCSIFFIHHTHEKMYWGNKYVIVFTNCTLYSKVFDSSYNMVIHVITSSHHILYCMYIPIMSDNKTWEKLSRNRQYSYPHQSAWLNACYCTLSCAATPASTTMATTEDPKDTEDPAASSSGLSEEAKWGIIGACIAVALIVIIVLIICCCCRQKKKQRKG